MTPRRLAEIALMAMRQYEQDCDSRRRKRSEEVFGHPGAFVPSAAPRDVERVDAMAEALALAMRTEKPCS